MIPKKPWFIDLSRLTKDGNVRIGSFDGYEKGDELGQITVRYIPIDGFRVKKIYNVPEHSLKQVPARLAPKEGAYVLTCDNDGAPFLEWLGIAVPRTEEELRKEIMKEKSRLAAAEARIRRSEIGESAIFKDFAEKEKVLRAARVLKRLPEEEEEEY